MQVYSTCQHCKKTEEWETLMGMETSPCPCGFSRTPNATTKFLEAHILNQCPICGCPHLYRQKDFNRRFGVFLIVIGIALAYYTYGISLLIVTLLDLFLWRRVKDLGICYKCQAQFRDSPRIDDLQTFNLALHDHYKNLVNAEGGSGTESHSRY